MNTLNCSDEVEMCNQSASLDAYHDVIQAKLPVEILEAIIEVSHYASLRSWTTVCKILFPCARHHLFSQSTLCLRTRSHAMDFIQWAYTTGTAANRCVKRLRFGGGAGQMECWFAGILERLDKRLDGVQSLTIDFTGVPVRSAIFGELTGLCCQNERKNIKPLTNLRHLEMVGAETIAAYRVLEVVSLFPRLETLKMKNFRWNVLNGLQWIPFPAHLRHMEADIEQVLNPASFIFALFGESEEKQDITSFSLRVNNDHTRSLEQFDDSISQAHHRNYFHQILQTLDRVIPDVEHLKLDVSIDSIKTEDETRALLNQRGLLRKLRTLSVNDVQILKDEEQS